MNKRLAINYVIREMKKEEFLILEDMLYEAIFQEEGQVPLPRNIIEVPMIKVYIEDFGKADDECLVAVVGEEIIGAVWTRILAGEVKGYGNIDPFTPEFAIAVKKAYQKQGIGTALMREMLKLLKERGYEKTSLSVDKKNYAVRMYEAVGFEIIHENKDDYLMVCRLKSEN